MQNFAAIGPFGAEIWRGGQIDPPPSKNLLSKSPVKIGLRGGEILRLISQKAQKTKKGHCVQRGGGGGVQFLGWPQTTPQKGLHFQKGLQLHSFNPPPPPTHTHTFWQACNITQDSIPLLTIHIVQNVMDAVTTLMISSHLPRAPCVKFVYKFLCIFFGIVGGYGVMYVFSLTTSIVWFLVRALGGKPG